jgi:hypothetical protein
LLDKLFDANVIQSLKGQSKSWLLEKTEKQFKDRACYLAIMRSVDILDGSDKLLGRDAIPDLLADAIRINFDSDIGHDYLKDWEARHAYYNRVENKIPFPLYMLNKVTGGGVTRKSLSLAIAGTGIGKTIALCNYAANAMMSGYKVLYITLEMAEEQIAQRIDAKLFQMRMDDVEKMSKDRLQTSIGKV